MIVAQALAAAGDDCLDLSAWEVVDALGALQSLAESRRKVQDPALEVGFDKDVVRLVEHLCIVEWAARQTVGSHAVRGIDDMANWRFAKTTARKSVTPEASELRSLLPDVLGMESPLKMLESLQQWRSRVAAEMDSFESELNRWRKCIAGPDSVRLEELLEPVWEKLRELLPPLKSREVADHRGVRYAAQAPRTLVVKKERGGAETQPAQSQPPGHRDEHELRGGEACRDSSTSARYSPRWVSRGNVPAGAVTEAQCRRNETPRSQPDRVVEQGGETGGRWSRQSYRERSPAWSQRRGDSRHGGDSRRGGDSGRRRRSRSRRRPSQTAQRSRDSRERGRGTLHEQSYRGRSDPPGGFVASTPLSRSVPVPSRKGGLAPPCYPGAQPVFPFVLSSFAETATAHVPLPWAVPPPPPPPPPPPAFAVNSGSILAQIGSEASAPARELLGPPQDDSAYGELALCLDLAPSSILEPSCVGNGSFEI